MDKKLCFPDELSKSGCGCGCGGNGGCKGGRSEQPVIIINNSQDSGQRTSSRTNTSPLSVNAPQTAAGYNLKVPSVQPTQPAVFVPAPRLPPNSAVPVERLVMATLLPAPAPPEKQVTFIPNWEFA